MRILKMFLQPNVEKLAAKRDVQRLLKALVYNDLDTRRQAAEALGKIRSPVAVDALIARLTDSDNEVRCSACRALQTIGDSRAVQSLVGLLAEKDKEVNSAAATALKSFGSAAVGPLIREIQGGRAQSMAAAMLGELRDVRALSPLIDYYQRAHASPSADMVNTLKSFGPPAIEGITALLSSSNTGTRLFGVKALGLLKDPAGLPPLLGILRQDDLDIRRTAAEALGELGWQPEHDELGARYWIAKGECQPCIGIGDPAVRPLCDALNSPSWEIQRDAAIALGEIGNPQALDPLFGTLRDKNQDVRRHAAEALMHLGWEPKNDALAARYWLAKLDSQKCIQVGDPAINVLLQGLTDGHPETRECAKAALQGLSSSSPISSTLGLFMGLLSGDSAETRKEAAHGLLHLFLSGEIDEPTRQRILDRRDAINVYHEDGHNDRHYDDPPNHSSDCHSDSRTDEHADGGRVESRRDRKRR